MSKNICTQYFYSQIHFPGIVIFHKFENSHSHGGIYSFQRKFNKNCRERWSPNNFMQGWSALLLFLGDKKRKDHLKLLFTLNFWLLICFDLPSYISKLRKRHKLRLLLMCLEEGCFGSAPAWGNGWQMTHLWERFAWRELRVGENYAN